MLRAIVAASLILIASCQEPPAPPPPGPAKRPPPATKSQPIPPATPARKVPPPEPAGEEPPAPDPRQLVLQAALDRYRDKPVSHSRAALSEDEEEMLGNLLEASDLVEALYMLQKFPDNLKWRDQIRTSGTDIEKRVFERYRSPFCPHEGEAACSPLPEPVPPREMGAGLWPENLTAPELSSLKRAINARELLSPYTVVTRNEQNRFEAIPFAKSDLLGSRMAELAGVLRSAARTAPHPSLKHYLVSRAEAFESDSPFPCGDSDEAWRRIKGAWEVLVGPLYTDEAPRQIKAFFAMLAGRLDPALDRMVEQLQERTKEMETGLKGLVENALYQAVGSNGQTRIRPVDVWVAGGQGRPAVGGALFYGLAKPRHSTRRNPAKKLLILNHAEATEPAFRARAEILLSEEQRAQVDIRAHIRHLILRELGTGLGISGDLRVTTPKGKTVAVKDALKGLLPLLNALGAEGVALWMLQYRETKKWARPNQTRSGYLAAVLSAATSLAEEPGTLAYERAACLLGSFLDAGAVTWRAPGTGRLVVDLEKMPAAVEGLVKKVMTLQLNGDGDQAAQWVNRYILKGDKDGTAVRGALAGVRAVLQKELKQAGIKQPSLRYEVTE